MYVLTHILHRPDVCSNIGRWKSLAYEPLYKCDMTLFVCGARIIMKALELRVRHLESALHLLCPAFFALTLSTNAAG